MAGMVLSMALLARWAIPSFPIDPLWAKNLTYFFGHSVANLTMYVAAGVVYGLLPRYAGRPWKTSNVLSLAWVCSLIMVLFAYPHHLYEDFVQPAAVQLVGQTASYLASLPPAVVTIFGALLLVYGSRFRWTLGSIMLFAGLLGWAVGGIAALLDATIPLNFVLHNTLWVPAHFHTYLLCGVVLFGLAFVSDLVGEPEWLVPRALGPLAVLRGCRRLPVRRAGGRRPDAGGAGAGPAPSRADSVAVRATRGHQ
jgi:cytochrome c oxidase subunit 1